MHLEVARHDVDGDPSVSAAVMDVAREQLALDREAFACLLPVPPYTSAAKASSSRGGTSGRSSWCNYCERAILPDLTHHIAFGKDAKVAPEERGRLPGVRRAAQERWLAAPVTTLREQKVTRATRVPAQEKNNIQLTIHSGTKIPTSSANQGSLLQRPVR